MREIFISYRRSDTMESGDRLYADLSRMFGKGAVFMDQRGGSLPWGEDWDRALRDGLENCEALVALIGPQWSTFERPPGMRALDAPDDWVRNEIATACRRWKKVLPVLLRRDQAPSENDLPAELRELGFHHLQAYPISQSHWEAETEKLVEVLKENPKLKELHDRVTGERGIRQLEKLIRENAQVADAVSRSRVVIETADRVVDEIKLLKNIHDALHEIESKSLIPVRNELQVLESSPNIGETATIRALASARRKFVQQERLVQASQRLLAELVPSLSGLLGVELPERLAAATLAFDTAANTQKIADFDHLVGELEGLGGAIPARLNDEIERAMRRLELHQLGDLMTAVIDLLGPAAAANRELKPMFAGLKALNGLRGSLASRVRDHGLLQGLDNKLRSMFGGQYRGGTWEDVNRASLSANWNSIQRLRERFTAPFSPVFQDRRQDLEQLEAEIKAAIARDDKASDVLGLLNDYANEVGELFREVDSNLKTFCAELRETTLPLKAILQQIEPEPQNV
jgi:TIR domain